jgi:hypothetical protein
LVGNHANGEVEWQPAGEPEQVLVHDFPDPKAGKAILYGVDDLGAGTGWMSVGCDPGTAAFAVATAVDCRAGSLPEICQKLRYTQPRAAS